MVDYAFLKTGLDYYVPENKDLFDQRNFICSTARQPFNCLFKIISLPAPKKVFLNNLKHNFNFRDEFDGRKRLLDKSNFLLKQYIHVDKFPFKSKTMKIIISWTH